MDDRLIGRRRSAVSVAFLAFGIVGGSFVPRLPALRDHLPLPDAQVGYALLFFAVGAVAGATAARFVLARGARSFVRAGTPALCVALVTPGLAGNLAELMGGFLLIGVCSGLLDVLENAQGAELERRAATPLINGFHGFWSLGAIIGSVGAGLAAYFGIAPLAQFAAAGVIVAAATASFLRELPDTRSGAAGATPAGARRLWLRGAVVAVAAMAFSGFIVEGGSADWSTLYLRDLSHVNAGIAAAGYAAFSLAAMLTRFRADLLTARTSPVVVARLGAVVAACGLALAFAAGANLGASGTALAVVMTSGYAGSIVGPALIGNAADRFGLRVAMLIPLAGAIGIAMLAGSLRPAPALTGSEASPIHENQARGRKV